MNRPADNRLFAHRPTAEPSVRRHQVLDPARTYVPQMICLKLMTPPESNVTLFAGGGKPVELGSSTLAAFRTRAVYPFAIRAGLDEKKSLYYGTIDVIRGPAFPEDIDPREAPIPIVFDDEDIAQIIRDRMISKYIVLEDPEKALDFATSKDQPLRYDATLSENPVKRAKEIGKILIVVHVGNRIPEREELAGLPVGNILISKSLPIVDASGQERMLRPEFVAGESYPEGPIQQVSFCRSDSTCNTTGTRSESSECADGSCPPPAGSGPGVNPLNLINNDLTYNFEYLCDGGDRRPRVGWVVGGVVVNVDPEDTIAEYRAGDAGKRFAVSNRVCLFAPRYVEIRTAQIAGGYDTAQGYAAVYLDRNINELIDARTRRERKSYQGPELALGRKRAKGLEGSQWASDFFEVRVLAGFEAAIGWASVVAMFGPAEVSNVDQPLLIKRTQFVDSLTLDMAPQIVAMTAGTGEVKAYWSTQEIKRIDLREKEPPVLKLEKTADRDAAEVGDEVTFAIRYTNLGKQTITNIAVMDSLTTRLEYIEGSAQSQRDAVFTARPNDAGSIELRWEIKGELAPGESGIVTFKTRIR